ncbi:MAG: ABC transporter ATP-binding protein/permease [Maledivibacter sp.]|jgi:ATP-binding cassette subfamily B protein|nr:ABC transporter ATP-binding protein/permease [Maledivibacter sp.]
MIKNYPKNLSELISPIKTQAIVTVILSVLGSLSLVIGPIAITIAVSNIMLGDTNRFLLWIIIAGLGILLRQILHMASLGYAHIVEAKFRYYLRKDFAEKLSRLPLGFFTTTSSGAIRKLISDDTIKIHTIIAHGFSEVASAISLPIGCVIVMLFFEWRTALMVISVIFTILIIGMIWMAKKSRSGQDINSRYEQAQREMSHAAIEMVDGIKEIKNFGLANSLFARFENAVSRFSNTSYEWLSGGSKPMAFMMSAIQPAVIVFFTLVVCIFSIGKGWLSPEETILFLLLSMALPTSFITLMQIGNHIRDGKHSLDTLLELYAKADQIYKENPKKLVLGDIEFNNVSFSYEKGNQVLKNINCIIPKGKITALVGPSGGGKTTMARLIARFWDVESGRLSIGGVNIKNVAEKDLLAAISLVFQDISLMQGSIADNIALSKPNARKEEIENAAKAAFIHDRIMELPNAYNSVIGEDNVVLSGGERQRLTIARAFLADTPIVILDEATAQADAQSEAEIKKALSSLGKDKTVVIIAHRLQSIVNAHQILVIGDGEIKQVGKHDELANSTGIYQNMWQAQNHIGGEN